MGCSFTWGQILSRPHSGGGPYSRRPRRHRPVLEGPARARPGIAASIIKASVIFVQLYMNSCSMSTGNTPLFWTLVERFLPFASPARQQIKRKTRNFETTFSTNRKGISKKDEVAQRFCKCIQSHS